MKDSKTQTSGWKKSVIEPKCSRTLVHFLNSFRWNSHYNHLCYLGKWYKVCKIEKHIVRQSAEDGRWYDQLMINPNDNDVREIWMLFSVIYTSKNMNGSLTWVSKDDYFLVCLYCHSVNGKFSSKLGSLTSQNNSKT